MPSPNDPFQTRVRGLQIIALALPMGASAAVVIFAFLRHSSERPVQQPFVSWLATGFFIVLASLAFVLTDLITRARMKQLAPEPTAEGLSEKLFGIMTAMLIVRLAMLEGPTLFTSIAYFLEGQVWTLIMAIVGVGLMLAQFPTEGRAIAWLEKYTRGLR